MTMKPLILGNFVLHDHGTKVFRNHYQCPCGCKWHDVWSAACDDRCPDCDTSCSPSVTERLA